MVKRRSKKSKSGSHGYGSSKKNRGAGNRGGRGNAGSGKKGQSKKMTDEGVQEMGEHGFSSRQEPQDGINLRDIDQRIQEFIDQGVAEEKEDGYVFHADEAGYDKILGGGKLTREIEIRAESFSDSAKEKIEEAGVEPVTIED
ncbi:50S ribosomal protein L15 [Nanohaloarchaea archaeon]|jgi:large subunit ribosomal protein L15|nr:50S ribosomal protein L15 [Candidatus Nanohaloarchaea archaeon]